MAGRDIILLAVERIYEARVRGDKQALALYWAADSTFRIAGQASLGTALAAGPSHPDEAVGSLIDQFRFHSAHIVDAVIEGRKAAIRMQVLVSAGAGDPVETELLDLWEFDDEGRFTSLIQFIDTALALQLALEAA